MHYGTERGEAAVAGCAACYLILLAGGRGRARLKGAIRCDAGTESAHGGARGRAGYWRLERLFFSPSWGEGSASGGAAKSTAARAARMTLRRDGLGKGPRELPLYAPCGMSGDECAAVWGIEI